MHTDRCGKTHRQKCLARGRGKEAKIQDFMYRFTTKGLRKNLEYIPGKHSIDSLQ